MSIYLAYIKFLQAWEIPRHYIEGYIINLFSKGYNMILIRAIVLFYCSLNRLLGYTVNVNENLQYNLLKIFRLM